MSHEIFDNQIAWANEVPWHGLGTQMSPDATGEEFLKAAKLDWEVRAHPLYAEIEGERIAIPNKSAFIRSSDNKVMTVASNDWKPLQNRDAIEFMQRYVTAGGAQIEVVGALRDGAVVWGLARLGHAFEVRPGDRSEGYLLINVPHVVGKAISVSTTAIRVVCANTMAMAERAKELHYKQNHLKEFDVEAAKATIEAAHESLAAAERRSKTLDSLKLTMEDAVKKVLVPIFEPKLLEEPYVMNDIMSPDVMPRSISDILASIEHGPGAIPDTGWGVLAGVTHYLDHVKGNKQETRWGSAIQGASAAKKLKVEQALFEMA